MVGKIVGRQNRWRAKELEGKRVGARRLVCLGPGQEIAQDYVLITNARVHLRMPPALARRFPDWPGGVL